MSETRRYLRFLAGGVHCALPTSVVRETLDAVKTTRVPGADACVEGVALAHGEAIAVIDLSQRLGRVRGEIEGPVMLVQAGDERVGLRVDGVLGEHECGSEALTRAVDGATIATMDCDGESTRVLDVLGVLPPSMRG